MIFFMKKIAHRGIHNNNIKENTLEAFQESIKREDYVGFEFDIRTSKDGIFFIHHNIMIDGKILRLLESNELIHTYHLPTLEDVLKLKTKKIMLLEIKEANLDISNFIRIIEKYPNTNLYIDSFDNQIIHKLEGKTHAKLGVLNYILNSEENYKNYDFIGLMAPIMTEKLYQYFEDSGKEIFIYANKRNPQNIYPKAYYIVDE